MPLILKNELKEDGVYGVWKVSEDEQYFLSLLKLFPSEQAEVSHLSARKRLEWLASRYLLHLLLGEKDRIPCLKDRYGKPHLTGSHFQISLSHSGDLVAVVIYALPCGIDVQYPVEKIHRIAKRFVNDDEQKYLNPTDRDYIMELHTIWGAKEAIYKAYGRKGLDFKNEIKIDPFKYNSNFFNFSGFLQRETFTMEFECSADLIHDFVLVLALSN